MLSIIMFLAAIIIPAIYAYNKGETLIKGARLSCFFASLSVGLSYVLFCITSINDFTSQISYANPDSMGLYLILNLFGGAMSGAFIFFIILIGAIVSFIALGAIWFVYFIIWLIAKNNESKENEDNIIDVEIK